jgi:hypothetical protein
MPQAHQRVDAGMGVGGGRRAEVGRVARVPSFPDAAHVLPSSSAVKAQVVEDAGLQRLWLPCCACAQPFLSSLPHAVSTPWHTLAP